MTPVPLGNDLGQGAPIQNFLFLFFLRVFCLCFESFESYVWDHVFCISVLRSVLGSVRDLCDQDDIRYGLICLYVPVGGVLRFMTDTILTCVDHGIWYEVRKRRNEIFVYVRNVSYICREFY